MEKPNRTLAFLAYLIPLFGPLFVLFVSRKNLFAAYHACQSLALLLVAVIVPLAWLVLTWLVIWVPLAGGLLMGGLFGLVIAAYLALVVAWLFGLSNSLNGQQQSVPFFGGWGERLFDRLGIVFMPSAR